MMLEDLKPTEDFFGRLGLAVLGGLGLMMMVLALMVVAYFSGPKHDTLGSPPGGRYVSPGHYPVSR